MIDTEDMTAKGGRDYSKVHAKLVFGMGVNKRTVKIPVVSSFIEKNASFKIKLQEAQGALIGDNNTAVCTIKKSDKNFEYANLKSKDALKTREDGNFGSIANENQFGTPAATNGISIHDVNGGSDYDLDSIFLDDPITIYDAIASFRFEDTNENSYHRYYNDNKSLEIYIENHSVTGEDCLAEWSIYTSCDRNTKQWRYNGFQIEWSCSSTNADILIQELIEHDDYSTEWHNLYNQYGEEWNTKTTNFFMDNKQLYYYYFRMKRYDGVWRTSPTLKIEAIRPIHKMFKINNIAPEMPELIGDNGELTKNHKYTKYAITSIDGAKSDHTAVGWCGKTITVKLDNDINNPFYIKNLYIRKPGTTDKYLIASNEDTSATTISFKVNEDFIRNNDKSINQIDRPGTGGGHIGEFDIEAELGTKPAIVKIEKDDRVDVNIWDDKYKPTISDETKDYTFRIGDVLHFNAKMASSYEEQYKCDGLNVYYVNPYSPDWGTIRRPDDGSEYFPYETEITEIKIVPEVSPIENVVKVMVPKTDWDKFDLTYGLFATASETRKDTGNYYECIIESDGTKITGRYFDIKARCKDSNMTPVWYENHKEDVKYTQNEYYFLGSEFAADNIIYLTCETADSTPYSLVGKAYYEEVPIGGKTSDKYWQEAANIGILIDETHFGYSDNVGAFATLPGKGIAGYYNRFKVASDGVDKYLDVVLTNDKKTTRTYTIEYQAATGEIVTRTMTEFVNEVNPEDVLISNVQTDHPSVDGIGVYNMSGSSFDAVYINDNVTILKAAVTATKSDGSYYTYTYTDENGNQITENEHVVRVEFVVIDKMDHSVKTVIEATKSNADKTEWETYYTFERGNYGLYMSDDKLYVRIVTDRKVGDGKGEDPSGGGRQVVPVFNETTYQAISTSYVFIEQAEQQPYPVDFPFPADSEHAIELPIIGNLSTMLNACGMSFGITSDGDRTRLYIGKKLDGGGNRYDGNGKPVSDTGYDVGLSNFKDAFSDMTDFINGAGTKRLKTMTLGIPTWEFSPVIGVYFEFMLYHDPSAHVTDQFLFTGGGGYFGGTLDLRYTFYFLVVGIPCYVGGELALTMVAEFGVAVDDGVQIVLNDPSQSFFDDLFTKTHFEFLIRAFLAGTAYVGAGIAGTIGIRGGFQLNLSFIYNPFVRKKYSQVEHTVGFAVTGGIKLWADAVLLTIPIPIYDWPYPLKLGYFKDVEELFPDGNSSSSLGGSANNTLSPRPRFGSGSTFMANSVQNDGLFGGTYVEDSERTLVSGVYDASEPRLMKYQDDKAILVYLDDDHSRGSLDRTVLRYMLYDASTDTWTQPQNVWSGNSTADFYPNLCDCGDKILLSWSSRVNTVNENVAKSELIKNLEVWTMFFDKATGTFDTTTPEQITNDDAFDYYPQASYDPDTESIHLYYLKKANVNEFNTAEEFLNEIQTEGNGAYLMYMLYTDPGDGGGKRWLRDYYYGHELPSGLSPAERDAYINTWRGQRFKNLAINIGGNTQVINDPNISDFATAYVTIFDASEVITEIRNMRTTFANYNAPIGANPTAQAQIDNFTASNVDRYKSYNILAYVVESDGDPTTKNDTDIYLKIQLATESEVKTIRVTYNSVPDTAPKIVETTGGQAYLLWIQNESMIKMLSLNSLILKSIDEDHANNGIKAGDVSIDTLDKIIMGDKISNVYPFTDDDDNLYIAWQQNSNENYANANDSEIDFKQDLYVAGLITTIDTTTGATIKSWSNPVRFTNNGKVNDLPTAISINGKLLLVNNQYNLKSSGNDYVINNSNLQSIKYKEASSLEIVAAAESVENTNSDGSARYRLLISAQNAGLFATNGYTYSGGVYYDNTSLTSINGSSSERVLPGEETTIGRGASDVIYFTLTREQQHHLDKVKVRLNIKDNGIADSGKETSKNVFDVNERFDFAIQNELVTNSATNKNLRVKQVENGFEIKGILGNSGNVDSFGNERIYVIDQSDWKHPIAKSEYINLPLGKQINFNIPISYDVLKDNKYGVKDLVLYVANDDGKKLSDYEVATVNARIPYNFIVNGATDKIELKVGEKLTLNTTFEPSNKYRSANILYSVKDSNIAKTSGNTIYGLAEGTTTLRLATKEFGGSKEIEVNVISNIQPHGGGSSGGGGGGGPITYTPTITTVNAVMTNAVTLDASKVSWEYDPVNYIWKLNLRVSDTELSPLTNGFYKIERERVTIINGMPISNKAVDTYYFDANGKMITGWVGTTDGKWYFFEDAKTMDEGKMVIGWKNLQGSWYYFADDGAMLVNAVTPDGFIVGADGKWVQKVG